MAAARASEAERRERRAARAAGGHLADPAPPSTRRPACSPSVERRQTSATIAVLVALNILVFLVFPEWGVRAMVLCVSLLAAPVLHTMLFRR